LPNTLQSRVLRRAADAAGGPEKLAERLGGYSPITVRAWMNGSVKPPEDVFFKAVAILHDEDAPAAGDLGDEAEPPQDAAPSRD
jgi:hypothetical protein